MCGGVGAGVVRPGQAFISLGTSGVYFLANDRFIPSRRGGMHTHRHALPGLYCQQGCVLSAAGGARVDRQSARRGGYRRADRRGRERGLQRRDDAGLHSLPVRRAHAA